MTERRELKISVRNLVEFIFREGDINSTGLGTRNPEAMQLGNKIHKKYKKYGNRLSGRGSFIYVRRNAERGNRRRI